MALQATQQSTSRTSSPPSVVPLEWTWTLRSMLELKLHWVRLHQRYIIYSQTESIPEPFFDPTDNIQLFQQTFPLFEVRI